jgi:hypothetical protein
MQKSQNNTQQEKKQGFPRFLRFQVPEQIACPKMGIGQLQNPVADGFCPHPQVLPVSSGHKTQERQEEQAQDELLYSP